jgi:hypothetical protein
MHPLEAEVPRHPGRDLGAAPQPAIFGRGAQPLGQGSQHVFPQQVRRPAIPSPLVAERRRAMRVGAGRQFLHPARRKGQHLGDLEEGPPLCQQPDRLIVPRLGHIAGRSIARLQLPKRQMIDDPGHGATPSRAQAGYHLSPVPGAGLHPTRRSPGDDIIPTRILADPFLPSASAGLEQVKVYAGWYQSPYGATGNCGAYGQPWP